RAGLETRFALGGCFRSQIRVARIIRHDAWCSGEDGTSGEGLELVKRARRFARLTDRRPQLQAAHPTRQKAILGHYPRDVGFRVPLEPVIVAERRIAVDAQAYRREQRLAERQAVLNQVTD